MIFSLFSSFFNLFCFQNYIFIIYTIIKDIKIFSFEAKSILFFFELFLYSKCILSFQVIISIPFLFIFFPQKNLLNSLMKFEDYLLSAWGVPCSNLIISSLFFLFIEYYPEQAYQMSFLYFDNHLSIKMLCFRIYWHFYIFSQSLIPF